MHLRSHLELRDRHAHFSPSKYHWINYDDDKMERIFRASLAAHRGSELHALAHDLIRLGVQLPDTTATLNRYVNDCIGHRMKTEQTLYFSDNFFGTADAFRYEDAERIVRCFDLKTGVTPVTVHQLEVYAALFCLEYGTELRLKPFDLEFDFRIYQNDDVARYEGDPAEIFRIMDKMQSWDPMIDKLRWEAIS